MSLGGICVLDWQYEMGLSKFQAGRLSQLVIVLPQWDRISMIEPPGCAVISAYYHLSLYVSHLPVTGMCSLLWPFAFGLLFVSFICTLGVLCVLLFCMPGAFFTSFSLHLPFSEPFYFFLSPLHALSFFYIKKPPLYSQCMGKNVGKESYHGLAQLKVLK